MDGSSSRQGARNRRAIPPAVLAQLNAGTLATVNLVEGLALDFAALLGVVAPALQAQADAQLLPTLGITQRMMQAGKLLLAHDGLSGYAALTAHPSDTVRGWAAYLLAASAATLPEKLTLIRPLADDPHFGVREWAWLALRPAIIAESSLGVDLLQPWVQEPSANLRRFAVEITRPRGVWCSHFPAMKAQPALGLPLLAPCRADASRYVQDAVANWLNDASKSHPGWVSDLCAVWQNSSDSPSTRRICARALRTLSKTAR